MNKTHDLSGYSTFSERIARLNDRQVSDAAFLVYHLLIAQDDKVNVAYCPFELVNPEAKLMIIGITPGPTQLRNAVTAFRDAYRSGLRGTDVLHKAKLAGAFSGPLRNNLVALLDEVGLNRYAGVSSCASFFGADNHLVQTTSLIGNASFLLDGTPYNGSPDPLKNEVLRTQIFDVFMRQVAVAKDALLLPLGPVVEKALVSLCEMGLIDRQRVLFGMPHPGAQNAERIKYFLGQKPAAACSNKTNTALLDSRKADLTNKIKGLLNNV